MISEILQHHGWLWPVIWQSTTILALGLGGSVLLRRRAVRAHQLLLLALIAAFVVPGLSHLVKERQWGLLQTRPKAIAVAARPVPASRDLSHFERAVEPRTAGIIPPTSAEGLAHTHTISVPSSTWKSLMLPLWIVLGAALLVRLTVRFLLGHRLAKRSVSSEIPELAGPLVRAKAKMGLACDVEVRRSAETHSPVIWCWGTKPLLLVPTEVSEHTDWDSVICHELAHWKRRDHLSGLWAELIVCLLPWNPLSWLAQRRLVRLSEEACDDWVIASGQVGTRYARTLLGLTPQGRAALIPAVVTSRKGLAIRVRRILADQCASPQSGVRWTLAATALVACLAIGIAFAQARPAEQAGTLTTKLAHGAAIEQLAPATTIKGVVLDPNGTPAQEGTYVTALPMTSYGIEPDSKGQFELPWSPAWAHENQTLCLMARDRRNGLAAIVDIHEPTMPQTIHLKPASTLRGQVADPNANPIPRATVILSLAGEFKCRVPIAASQTNDQGVFEIKGLPHAPAYKLLAQMEGYQSGQAVGPAVQRSVDVIDIGTLTLTRRDATTPVVTLESPDPNWQKRFQELYRLAPGETIKLIKPPFATGHQEYLIDLAQETYDLEGLVEYGYPMCSAYQWNGHLDRKTTFGGRSLPRIRSVLNWILDIPDYDFVIPETLQQTGLPKGDWIVRHTQPIEEQLRALEAIIRSEMGRSIRFEKRTVQRDTIVVTGRYSFTPWPGKDPNRLYLFVNDRPYLHEGEAHSLPDLLDKIADGINVAIDNRTEPVETGKIRYLYGDNVVETFPETIIDKDKDLPLLLEDLAKQTNLTFTVEQRPADVWFISEDTQEKRGS